jgi:hypothetical protein
MITTEYLESASHEERANVIEAAVSAASGTEKKELAATAVDALSPEERKELIESMWPPGSKDRRWVYIAGFVVAGAVAVGLGAIAWGAQGGDSSIAASLVVLATGFISAMIGGLLGAYVQK